MQEVMYFSSTRLTLSAQDKSTSQPNADGSELIPTAGLEDALLDAKGVGWGWVAELLARKCVRV